MHAIATVAADAIDASALRVLEEMWTAEWPPRPDRPADPLADDSPCAFAVARVGGAVVGGGQLLVRSVTLGEERFDVAGLGGLLVHADHRRRGIGSAIVGDAVAWATREGFAAILLFCGKAKVPYYTRLGFAEPRCHVVIHRFGEAGTLRPDNHLFYRLLQDRDLPGLNDPELALDVGNGAW
jgi:predicted N-acetyltransferase YhbS